MLLPGKMFEMVTHVFVTHRSGSSLAVSQISNRHQTGQLQVGAAGDGNGWGDARNSRIFPKNWDIWNRCLFSRDSRIKTLASSQRQTITHFHLCSMNSAAATASFGSKPFLFASPEVFTWFVLRGEFGYSKDRAGTFLETSPG